MQANSAVIGWARSALTVFWFAAATCSAAEPVTITADLCIYGGTSGGVVAAVQAARMGKSAVVIEPTSHLGGMSSGGLGWTDFGNKAAIGGLAHEYYQRIGKHYGREIEYNLEPHVAERVFNDLATTPGVTVRLDERLAQVQRAGGRITAITSDNGTVYRAAMFIDATYEGDLMAAAGVSYIVGREANSQYGETVNGIQGPAASPRAGKFLVPVDPYRTAGDPASGLLPLVDPGPHGTVGEADHRVQSYNFRVCLTRDPNNRREIEPPPGYDPTRYELLARWIEARIAHSERYEGRVLTAETMALSDFLKYDPLPGGKFDFNNRWPISTDHIGGPHEYPEADWPRRAEIFREHENYLRGFFHFLATSPRVPQRVRQEMSAFGLARDEFTDNNNWPHQLYVREARRMIGQYVMTEHHCRSTQTAPDSVALGAYGIDLHATRRIVIDGQITNEGSRGAGVPRPYPIAYGSIVPRPEVGQSCGVRLDPHGAGIHGAEPIGRHRRLPGHRRGHCHPTGRLRSTPPAPAGRRPGSRLAVNRYPIAYRMDTKHLNVHLLPLRCCQFVG
jgi:hypothetical protein